jgi:predicted O-linked N-acetylglucosamine transferase (SPINDLY family)
MNAHSGISNQALKKALAHHEAGRLQDAERLFRSFLKSEPHHPVANHSLGVLSIKLGKPQAAIPFLSAALRANPEEHRYWFALAEALIETGAVGDARNVLEKGMSQGLSGPSLSALATSLAHYEMYQVALAHHQAGRLPDAERGYREILAVDPLHVDSLHMLGVVALQTSRVELAVEMIEEAIRLNGAVAAFHCNLGNALDDLGRFDEAVKVLNKALQLEPNNFDALNSLGNVLLNSGKLDTALVHYKRAMKIKPDNAIVQNNIGNVFKAKKDNEKAIQHYEKAIDVDPAYVQAHNNRGVLLQETGDLQKAIECYRQALQFDPTFAEAHYNLAVTLQGIKQEDREDEVLEHFARAVELKPDFADAQTHLGKLLVVRGDLDAASKHFRQAVKFSREPASAHYELGSLLRDRGYFTDAIVHFRESFRLKPDSVDARNGLGIALWLSWQLEEAIHHFEEVLKIQPAHIGALSNLANIFQRQGKLVEAVAYYTEAIRLAPDAANIHSNRILALLYATEFPEMELVNRAREFGLKVADPLLRMRPFLNSRNPDRKLRIGFVSGDFRRHSVNYFFEPFLIHLDKDQFETFAYSNSHMQDAVTSQLRERFDHWRNITSLNDDAAADLIEADQIDILVDLSGHTASNRLLVFARKPAPIQITWLGFAATTGVRSIDYRITDIYAEPVGLTEHLSVEKLWRLPRCSYCYQGFTSGPAVIDHPPKDDNGYVTFGCFNNFARVNDGLLIQWAKIMERVPDARLLLEIAGLGDAEFFAAVKERLARLGLPLDRVILEPRSPANQFVLYNKIDIALDPFPANGGTTSMDTLWMGVPFVTVAGNVFSSRMGVMILTNAGLSELIAFNEDEYIEFAVELAKDDARLRSIRSKLSERKNPMMDPVSFSKDMGDAYREMWKIWCEQQDEKAMRIASPLVNSSL